jgi:hypothetical protein
MKKIIFKKPFIIPSNLDGIEICYPFTVFSSDDQINSSIRITITGHITNQHGFKPWQFQIPGYYDNFISMMFKYVEQKVDELKNTDFNNPEESIFFSSESPAIDTTLGPSIGDIDGKEIIL